MATVRRPEQYSESAVPEPQYRANSYARDKIDWAPPGPGPLQRATEPKAWNHQSCDRGINRDSAVHRGSDEKDAQRSFQPQPQRRHDGPLTPTRFAHPESSQHTPPTRTRLMDPPRSQGQRGQRDQHLYQHENQHHPHQQHRLLQPQRQPQLCLQEQQHDASQPHYQQDFREENKRRHLQEPQVGALQYQHQEERYAHQLPLPYSDSTKQQERYVQARPTDYFGAIDHTIQKVAVPEQPRAIPFHPAQKVTLDANGIVVAVATPVVRQVKTKAVIARPKRPLPEVQWKDDVWHLYQKERAAFESLITSSHSSSLFTPMTSKQHEKHLAVPESAVTQKLSFPADKVDVLIRRKEELQASTGCKMTVTSMPIPGKVPGTSFRTVILEGAALEVQLCSEAVNSLLSELPNVDGSPRLLHDERLKCQHCGSREHYTDEHETIPTIRYCSAIGMTSNELCEVPKAVAESVSNVVYVDDTGRHFVNKRDPQVNQRLKTMSKLALLKAAVRKNLESRALENNTSLSAPWQGNHPEPDASTSTGSTSEGVVALWNQLKDRMIAASVGEGRAVPERESAASQIQEPPNETSKIAQAPPSMNASHLPQVTPTFGPSVTETPLQLPFDPRKKALDPRQRPASDPRAASSVQAFNLEVADRLCDRENTQTPSRTDMATTSVRDPRIARLDTSSARMGRFDEDTGRRLPNNNLGKRPPPQDPRGADECDKRSSISKGKNFAVPANSSKDMVEQSITRNVHQDRISSQLPLKSMMKSKQKSLSAEGLTQDTSNSFNTGRGKIQFDEQSVQGAKWRASVTASVGRHQVCIGHFPSKAQALRAVHSYRRSLSPDTVSRFEGKGGGTSQASGNSEHARRQRQKIDREPPSPEKSSTAASPPPSAVAMMDMGSEDHAASDVSTVKSGDFDKDREDDDDDDDEVEELLTRLALLKKLAQLQKVAEKEDQSQMATVGAGETSIQSGTEGTLPMQAKDDKQVIKPIKVEGSFATPTKEEGEPLKQAADEASTEQLRKECARDDAAAIPEKVFVDDIGHEDGAGSAQTMISDRRCIANDKGEVPNASVEAENDTVGRPAEKVERQANSVGSVADVEEGQEDSSEARLAPPGAIVGLSPLPAPLARFSAIPDGALSHLSPATPEMAGHWIRLPPMQRPKQRPFTTAAPECKSETKDTKEIGDAQPTTAAVDSIASSMKDQIEESSEDEMMSTYTTTVDGETPTEIARELGLDVKELVRLNKRYRGLRPKSKLMVGTLLLYHEPDSVVDAANRGATASKTPQWIVDATSEGDGSVFTGCDTAVGSLVEAMDYTGAWLPGKVVVQHFASIPGTEEPREQVKIHFDGWSTKFDEWIWIDEGKVRRRAAGVKAKRGKSRGSSSKVNAVVDLPPDSKVGSEDTAGHPKKGSEAPAQKTPRDLAQLEFDHPGRKTLALTDEDSPTWSCNRCTLENPSANRHCSVCAASRPRFTSSKKAGGLARKEGTWLCPTCSTRNLESLDLFYCRNCGRPNPDFNKQQRTSIGEIVADTGSTVGSGDAIAIVGPRCGPCNRIFDTKSQLTVHLKSKGHLETLRKLVYEDYIEIADAEEAAEAAAAMKAGDSGAQGGVGDGEHYVAPADSLVTHTREETNSDTAMPAETVESPSSKDTVIASDTLQELDNPADYELDDGDKAMEVVESAFRTQAELAACAPAEWQAFVSDQSAVAAVRGNPTVEFLFGPKSDSEDVSNSENETETEDNGTEHAAPAESVFDDVPEVGLLDAREAFDELVRLDPSSYNPNSGQVSEATEADLLKGIFDDPCDEASDFVGVSPALGPLGARPRELTLPSTHDVSPSESDIMCTDAEERIANEIPAAIENFDSLDVIGSGSRLNSNSCIATSNLNSSCVIEVEPAIQASVAGDVVADTIVGLDIEKLSGEELDQVDSHIFWSSAGGSKADFTAGEVADGVVFDTVSEDTKETGNMAHARITITVLGDSISGLAYRDSSSAPTTALDSVPPLPMCGLCCRVIDSGEHPCISCGADFHSVCVAALHNLQSVPGDGADALASCPLCPPPAPAPPKRRPAPKRAKAKQPKHQTHDEQMVEEMKTLLCALKQPGWHGADPALLTAENLDSFPIEEYTAFCENVAAGQPSLLEDESELSQALDINLLEGSSPPKIEKKSQPVFTLKDSDGDQYVIDLEALTQTKQETNFTTKLRRGADGCWENEVGPDFWMESCFAAEIEAELSSRASASAAINVTHKQEFQVNSESVARQNVLDVPATASVPSSEAFEDDHPRELKRRTSLRTSGIAQVVPRSAAVAEASEVLAEAAVAVKAYRQSEALREKQTENLYARKFEGKPSSRRRGPIH